jgi:hypothetical protein
MQEQFLALMHFIIKSAMLASTIAFRRESSDKDNGIGGFVQ